MDGRILTTTEPVNGLQGSVNWLGASPQQIPARRAGSWLSYSVNGRSGKSVLEFQVKESGHDPFACDDPRDARRPEVVLAVGSGVGNRLGGTLLRGVGALFGGGISGGIVILAIYLMRRRSMKRLATNPQT